MVSGLYMMPGYFLGLAYSDHAAWIGLIANW
jgi:hypothetical protein